MVIEKTAHELKAISDSTVDLGLNDGLLGICLFYFQYSRYTSDRKFEMYAYDLIDKIQNSISTTTPPGYYNGLSGIGSVIAFLIHENFIDADVNEILEDFDNVLSKFIDENEHYDFGFQEGLIGVATYFCNRIQWNRIKLNHSIWMIIKKVLDCLESSLKITNEASCSINPIFLFPSEVIDDTVLFLNLLQNLNYTDKSVFRIKTALDLLKKSPDLLKSNCPEYYRVQSIRKQGIIGECINSQFLLNQINRESHGLALCGMAMMSGNDPYLPSWWKLL